MTRDCLLPLSRLLLISSHLVFCFRDISIVDPNPMDIIVPFCYLHSGFVSKGALTHHLMIIILSALSISGRHRVTLVYLVTLTNLSQSSSYGVLTMLHKKTMEMLMSFLDLDVTNSICATIWWDAVAHCLSSSVGSSSDLNLNILLNAKIVLLPVMTSVESSSTPLR